VCAQLHFNICREIGVKLDTEHWYKYVQKFVGTSQEGKVTILWYPEVKPTEPSLTINQTSQSVTLKKEHLW
jgi:hypothetical protein